MPGNLSAQNQIASIKKIVQQKPNLYDSVVINIANAVTDYQLKLHGDFLYVMDAPASLNATVKFSDSKADPLILTKGRRYVMPFVKLFITIPAGQVGTMTLIIGKDAAFDFSDIGVVNINAITNPVKDQAANNFNVAGSPVNVGAGATLIVAANANRQSITVINEGANPVRFGGAGVVFAGGAGGAGGVLVPAGGSYTFNHTAAIYGICGAALNSNVGFDEEYNT